MPKGPSGQKRSPVQADEEWEVPNWPDGWPMLAYWPTLEAQAMQKVLTCLFALSAFAALPAYAANDMISDQAIIEMAIQQHVIVRPAEVDARISKLRAENALPTPPAGTELRPYIALQIVREKVRR